MPTHTLAAALLAVFAPVSAFSQGSTPAPCPSDTTAKAKVKKGLGNILRGTPLGQAVAEQQPPTQPCVATQAAAAPPQSAAASSPSPQQSAAPPARRPLRSSPSPARRGGEIGRRHPREY